MGGTHASRKRAEVERTTILALESRFRCGVTSCRGRRVSGSDEPGGENDGYRARRAARKAATQKRDRGAVASAPFLVLSVFNPKYPKLIFGVS
jgi:hypothetical protein